TEAESESSEAEIDLKTKGPNKWLKATTATPATKALVKDKKKPALPRKATKAVEEETEEEEEEEEDGFTVVGKGGRARPQGPMISAETLNERLDEVVKSRGKKNTDKQETLKLLERLYGVAANDVQKVKVLLIYISAYFDSIPHTSYMDAAEWKKAIELLNELLGILEANPQIKVYESAEVYDGKDINYAGEPVSLGGSIISFVDRLEEEFIRSLQSIDPHTTEYVDRMRDDVILYAAIVRTQGYFERANLEESLNRVLVRRIEHLYYKPDNVNVIIEKDSRRLLPAGPSSQLAPEDLVDNPRAMLHALCTYVYKHGQAIQRTRAMLMQIYNHALHDRYYIARDFLLMSHLQESIQRAEHADQILYNRALVQLGLAAFRLGMISSSFGHLQEIMTTNRFRELLAQGVSQQRGQQLTPEQEHLGRLNQVPFHMFINLELLECVYLTCSMLLEIPSMAAAGKSAEARKKVLSKTFRRMLDTNERQVFTGPPENTRDHIMAASKALATGDWEQCKEFIDSIKIWDLMPNIEDIKAMLSEKIRQEALRTYLFTYASHYDSITVANLSEMFSLSISKVKSILSRMVYNEEVEASLDEVAETLVFGHTNVDPSSRLHQAALALVDKVNTLVETNERVFELKVNQGQTLNERQQDSERGLIAGRA
ncbi:Translation initiation factor 3 subunit c, partial [Spiromyces aspiralis]